MEYMSAPETEKNGEFLKDVYRNFVKRTGSRVGSGLAGCG